MAKKGQKRSRESHPAFQFAGHDADPPGVGLQDGFAEQAIVQALEYMNENEQMTVSKIENGREIVVEILTALERSEWRTRKAKALCEKRQYESGVSEMNSVMNEVNH